VTVESLQISSLKFFSEVLQVTGFLTIYKTFWIFFSLHLSLSISIIFFSNLFVIILLILFTIGLLRSTSLVFWFSLLFVRENEGDIIFVDEQIWLRIETFGGSNNG